MQCFTMVYCDFRTDNRYYSFCQLYLTSEFSLLEWTTEKHLNSTDMPVYARKVLLRDLGISQYIHEKECDVEYYSTSQGWYSGV